MVSRICTKMPPLKSVHFEVFGKVQGKLGVRVWL